MGEFYNPVDGGSVLDFTTMGPRLMHHHSLCHLFHELVRRNQIVHSTISSKNNDALGRGAKKMGLWTILEGFLLLANAMAILNEDRFLAPRGWSFSEFSTGQTKSFKGQLIGLVYATQYMRLPLILLNAICIVVMLISG
ncbi:hypothetical protein J1N35_042723 [Gossypium stocksii]|uniref:Yos1-like protein n=1 Tax=Gossypium stocksii TaxID=47602 RepID=A0A9D3U634_9ROSI|nr:hypothetical protein J1N35_042723 [Gossypium stocksii]